MESALYGIYALVVFVSEIVLVRCAHSFDFWYVNNSCVNTVRQHFPWSILYIHDIFSLWDMSKPDIEAFIEQANLHHPTIEFTAETFDTETSFLDTVVYKRARFKEKSILDAKTHFKQTENFLHIHFTSCHPPNVKKEFVKGEALRILRKKLLKTTFEEKNSNLKKNAWRTEATHNLW